MKVPVPPAPKTKPGGHVSGVKAGTYLGCGACGRLLRIEWATRSVICSCGARVLPAPPPR